MRKSRGFSQEKLAEECDLHPTYIGGIERGERNPSIQSLFKIADGLKVDVSALFLPAYRKEAGEKEATCIEILSLLESRPAAELKLIEKIISDLVQHRP